MTGGEDHDAVGLHRLLSDLADDPGAPPTTVSGLSVIAAAKAGDPAAAGRTPVPGSAAASLVGSAAAGSAAAGSAGATHLQSLHEDADRRAKRRRTMLLGGLAAACAVALAAIVIPIAVSNSSSTTSAGSAADQAAAREATGTAAATAGGSGPAATAGQDGSETAVPTIDPANPDANRPPPGENALSQALPVPGGPPAPDAAGSEGAAAGSGAAAGCWPALSDQASAALGAALPAGAFGVPEPLGLGCPADPVGGAQLAGTAPDTQVVVRVTRADPGACAATASETGSRCVARGGDQYVANDDGNLSVFAYGNGYEVEVGGRPATGIAPIPSGLSAEQLSVAAAAVLGTLGVS